MAGCFKTKFATQALAVQRLDKIKIGDDGKRLTTPVREYECIYCGHWHLTSMTSTDFHNKVVQPLQTSQKIKEQRFINQEAEYWKHRLKIKDDE